MCYHSLLFALWLALILPLTVTLEAKDVLLDRPTLLSLYPGIKHHGTILALKTVWMEVPVKSMYPGSLGLSLLGHYGVFADAAVGSKLSGEILRAVKTVLLVC